MNTRSVKIGAALLVVGGLAYAGVKGIGMASALANAAAVAHTPVFAEADPATLQHVADQLQITQDQRHRIQAILQNERTAAAPDIHALMATAQSVRAMTDNGDAGADKIHQAIAAQQPALQDAIVHIAKVKSEIYSVLTAAQRSKADAMLAAHDDKVAARINSLSGASDRLVSAMAWRLDLSDDQQGRVRSIVDSHKTQVVNLLRQLEAQRVQLQQTTRGGAFDDAAVRQAAAGPAHTAVDLATALATAKSEVFAVLTPDQRAKVEALRTQRQHHMMAFWHAHQGA